MPEGALRSLQWLERTPLASRVRESLWLYPGLEVLHILGFTVLVGAAVMFDLRLLGVSARIRVTDLARHLLRWSRLALLLVLPSGALLFTTQPAALALSPVFRLKLLLLVLAALNALLFHAVTFRGVGAWDQHVATPGLARAAALLSLTLWTGVIACGRLLAYV